MKNLIRKILKNYISESFEIKYHSTIDNFLLEEIRANQKEIKELGYIPTPISDAEESLIKNYLNVVNSGQGPQTQNFNPNGDGIIGIYKDKTGKEKKIFFRIRLTRHWYFRLHRTEDPKFKNKPKIVDPNPFECIDAIDRNANNLARIVVTKDPSPRIVWEINSSNMLNFLLVFEPENASGTRYSLVLVNQIKGENFFDRISQNKIPLR